MQTPDGSPKIILLKEENLMTNWQKEVLHCLQKSYQNVAVLNTMPFMVLGLGSVHIHLISLKNAFTAPQLIALQEQFSDKNKLLVHVWEDVWYTKPAQVLSRISSFLNKNSTIHGRQTQIVTVDALAGKNFFSKYHLQGFAKCKSYIGLTYKGTLVALAGWGDIRFMRQEKPTYYSIELIRFATKSGLTIVGGFSKLLKQAIQQFEVEDIMTYVDRDWSVGGGFLKLGFEKVGITEPLQMLVDKKSMKRKLIRHQEKQVLVSDENEKINTDWVKIFNTGNFKFRYCAKK